MGFMEPYALMSIMVFYTCSGPWWVSVEPFVSVVASAQLNFLNHRYTTSAWMISMLGATSDSFASATSQRTKSLSPFLLFCAGTHMQSLILTLCKPLANWQKTLRHWCRHFLWYVLCGDACTCTLVSIVVTWYTITLWHSGHNAFQVWQPQCVQDWCRAEIGWSWIHNRLVRIVQLP